MSDDSDKIIPDSVDEPTLPPTPNEPDATVAPRFPKSGRLDSDTTRLKNYELLDELGRGGMGVVHRARDRKLNRVIALKTIIAGNFATDEDVGRFRQEAQAAAKLDHPGIVEIYEVSDAASEQQFFSMKYIEGGSLADLKDELADDPRRAVEMMVKIADAVHHAHQRGVLHRDLKPANILIDDDDQPRITDFGLAKHLGSDSGLTRTGMVMGTPGFMAPEQASGKSDVTTAADVYALGAILYWLITGQPPHQGETQLETIMKTIQQDPASVRSHRDDADPGLDLICQKALRNEPSQRYENAEAFANDLRAWLAGEPLSVKPPTVFELVSLWIRKNFRSLAIGIVTGIICGGLIGLIILMLIAREYVDDVSYYQQLGDGTELWISKYFGWTQSIPDGIFVILPPLIVILTVMFGILNIRILKPQSREVVFVVAAISALMAGIVSFTTSLGWSPIIRHGIQKGTKDVRLMSDYIWLESDQERDLAREALFDRYPGLKNVDRNRRARLIEQKIWRDQAFGIPQGMWEGIGITLCLSAIPLFIATAFSGMIWRRDFRGFAHFGQSIELAIYSALFMLIFTRMFSLQMGAFPGWTVQLASLAGLALALWLGLSNARWYWRILAFVIANIAVFGNFAMSTRVQTGHVMAGKAQSAADFERAVGFLEMRIDQRKEAYPRFQAAVIYAWLNDDENYLRHCRELMSGTDFYLPEVAEQAAKVMLLKPELHDDLAKSHQLAETASVFADSSRYNVWLLFTRSLSELRKNSFDEALSWSEKCRAAFDAETRDRNLICLNATICMVEAIALFEKGQRKKSADKFDTGSRLMTKVSGRGYAWENRLIFEILQSEARRKLGKQ